ncbi:MAG TPA: DUF4214 domain-containing protein, partial [Pyrinomonadaceae bacterium]|nr:DUF4214 domain-containing protein [Pyrinomonadaceae bacterium]
GAACHRWGDYSSMSIDPSDDCTFWYTTQYFDTQANGDPAQRNWRTRIGSFKFPSCSAPTAAQSSINGRVTDSDGNGVGGVVVELSGASAATTITDSNGNYSFDNVETASFYTITPQLANYSFSPVNRSFSLAGNLTDATFTATLASNAANPLDTNMYFVRQQYLDFLGREPDSGGLQYWTSRFNECGGDAACITRKRIDVSAAFFMSQEFQETGSYVYRLYKAGLGRNLSYAEFSTDRSQVLAGDNLDARRAALAAAFVARPEFAQRYANATSAEAFADALLLTMKQSSGVDLSAQRDALVAKFNSGGSVVESRSLALQAIAEAEQFKQAEYNRSFVQMQYFGYLKRNPDQGGFDFWVDVLNNRVPGNFRAMVCAFITSGEYQNRFSAVITHSNSDCYGAL